MVESITFYSDTQGASPYSHRVALALEEVGAKYTKCQIDLSKKPDWFAEKVNPVSKIPVIAYGGPDVPADQPSPESIKLAESLVIVEFIADLYPSSTLLPKDPVGRAKARYFVEISRNAFQPWFAFSIRGEAPEAFEKALEEIQKLLPSDAKFAVGHEFTLADIAVAPLLARLDLMIKNDIGTFGEAQGKELVVTLKGQKFTRLWKYLDDIKARESFRKTFEEAQVLERFVTRIGRRT